MSTYCHRIIELKTKEHGWVNCGEICDNYHGFSQYNNDCYSNRGLPEDTCANIEMYKRDDGSEGYWCWGMSYITLPELMAWMEKERLEAMGNIKSEFIHSMLQQIADKLNGTEVEIKNPDDYYDVILSDNYYHEVFDELMDTYEGLHNQYVAADALAEHKYEELTGDSCYIDPEDVRITFFFS